MREGRILVEGKPVHYRIGGSGAPILLLHPSPSNSKALLPLANHLKDHFTVICMDTPGYGDSPAFDSKNYSMEAYTIKIHDFVKALGIDKLAIFGSATGGQLAIRYGIMYPDQVEHLFLDNCGHFPDDLRTDIIDDYFPDMTPQFDGSHLEKIWEVATHLFKYFPWCCKTEEYKLNVPPLPIEVYHTIAMEYLVAGEHYHRAYRSAFHHERVDCIQELTVPSTILRWQGSIVKKYTDAIFEYDLPDNVYQHIIPAQSPERFEAMQALMIEKYQSDKVFSTQLDDQLFNKYDQAKTRRMNHFSLMPDFPTLNMEGSHLKAAWNILKSKNPSADAMELQQMIIDWYAYSSKTKV